jgi:hypothetical protein
MKTRKLTTKTRSKIILPYCLPITDNWFLCTAYWLCALLSGMFSVANTAYPSYLFSAQNS